MINNTPFSPPPCVNKTSDNSELRKTFERAEVVGQWIEQIKKNVSNIKIYIQRVEDVKYNQKGMIFDYQFKIKNTHISDVRDKLQGWFQNNTSIAQQISTKLKEIDLELSNNKAESARARIQLIQYDSLKKRFEQIFLENSKELENYQNIQKDTIKAQLKAKGNIQVTDDELTALLDEGQDLQIFTDNVSFIIITIRDSKKIVYLDNFRNCRSQTFACRCGGKASTVDSNRTNVNRSEGFIRTNFYFGR